MVLAAFLAALTHGVVAAPAASSRDGCPSLRGLFLPIRRAEFEDHVANAISDLRVPDFVVGAH